MTTAFGGALLLGGAWRRVVSGIYLRTGLRISIAGELIILFQLHRRRSSDACLGWRAV
jgi:hypothetical protein